MEDYQKWSTTDNDEGSGESENDMGSMISEKKKMKMRMKEGWRFCYALKTYKIFMLCRSKLSNMGRDSGVEAKEYLYPHDDTCMVGVGLIILDTLDMECKI